MTQQPDYQRVQELEKAKVDSMDFDDLINYVYMTLEDYYLFDVDGMAVFEDEYKETVLGETNE